jgi:hypothetical protein
MFNSNQVKTRLGTKVDGTPAYGNLQDIITPVTPVMGEPISFSLSADGNLYPITGVTGAVYIDGTHYEAIDGGYIAVTGTDGTHTTNTAEVGGRVANISRVIDENDDEVIDIVLDETGKVEKRRFVYGLVSSSLGDGEAVADNKLQFNFVAWNDETQSFEAVDIKAGDYKCSLNQAYNNGTLAIAQKNGAVLSAYDVGGYAQDELLDLQDNKPMLYELVVDTEAQLQDDNTIIFTIGADNSASNIADTSGNELSGTDVQVETVIFASEDVGKTVYELNGGIVTYNGAIVQPTLVTVEDTNKIKADLSNTLTTGTIYIGDFITLSLGA